MELKALLQEMIDKKASDVFIVAGLPLTYTADGRQVRMDMAPLMPADTKELVDAIYELSGRDEQSSWTATTMTTTSPSPCRAWGASA